MQIFFFISGLCPDFLMNVLQDCIKFLIWTVWVLFDCYLKQKLFRFSDFQSDTSLKMPPSSPSMEEFGIDIQN